jgi:hypothetical protein
VVQPGEWLLGIVTWMLWLATARLVTNADRNESARGDDAADCGLAPRSSVSGNTLRRGSVVVRKPDDRWGVAGVQRAILEHFRIV